MREISHEVGEEDRDADELLDQHEDEPVRDRVREQVGQPGRQQEEEADREQQREDDRARPRRRRRCPAARPASSGGIWALAEMPSARKPILSDSRERDHAAHDRHAQQPVALRPGDERLGDHLDLALGALLGVGAAGRRAARRTACAPPRPRWRCRASSRPRARPGRRSGASLVASRRSSGAVPLWTRGRSPPDRIGAPSARTLARRELRAGELVRVVGLGGLRDRRLGVRLGLHETRALGPADRERRAARRARARRP